jgi:shikimate kinase / 3-dehydroquinate synthase
MPTVVLSGFMATGKSTLGPLVAEKLGLPFVDTDALLETRTGERVPDLWRTRGEAAFRQLEEALVFELFRQEGEKVIGFGGGTVTTRAVRRLALEEAFVVTLTTNPTTLLARIPRLEDRPALAIASPMHEIERLLDLRAPAYAECHLTLPTDNASPEETAALIANASKTKRVVVPLGLRSYPVDFVLDDPSALRQTLTQQNPSSVLVVTDENVARSRGKSLDASTEGLPSGTRVVLAPGEDQKRLEAVERIWNAAVRAGIDRKAVVLAFGGGVVGDLAGFAASTLLRGVRVVQAPTTLLAMVDASVGGKTGFDLPEGKNLIGSFHQPSAVVIDPAHLETLDARDVRAGLAEAVKMALGFDAELWAYLHDHAQALLARDAEAMTHVLVRAVALKARVVADDERESGARALLNLGHTLGHALEAADGYTRYRHGEAVAMGLVAEARAGERLGLVDSGVAESIRALLERLALPGAPSTDELRAAFPRVGADKKRLGTSLALPLARRIGESALSRVTLEAFERAALAGQGD